MSVIGTLINKFGRVAGWNNVKVVMLGRQVEGITALSYKDSVEKRKRIWSREYASGTR